MKKEVVLEIEDLNVKRSNEIIIKNANFTIDRGDYVGVVGPNGGGKTTLLHAILGFIPISQGKIKLFGKNILSFNNWERVAYVSQEAINFDNNFPLNVRELVGLGRINRNNLGRKLKNIDWVAVDESLELMGVKDLANKRIGNLSGGQKQRIFVAKALVRNPDIIFLDEPVAGIDASTLEKFYQKLSDLNSKKDITIIIVSHDLSAVFCRMSKLICINRDVYISNITDEIDPNVILKKVYGDHFHFVFHEHNCKGVFNNE
jgi:zinc transport system ATP-binding protein